MWDEMPLSELFPASEEKCLALSNSASWSGSQKRQKILKEIEFFWTSLKNSPKDYGNFSPEKREPKTLKFVAADPSGNILGTCPVASDRTRCCNLMTMDIFRNCPLDCSYCSIQTFFHHDTIFYHQDLRKKLASLQLDPQKTYHIGTGQSSDSLALGNKHGELAALLDFAGENPNVILELKSKSANIQYLLEKKVSANVIATWTLNTPTIIENEEHGTTALEQRFGAAKELARHGILVGFHFHPIIYYRDWQSEYAGVIQELTRNFRPQDVALISFGTLTFTAKVMAQIRNRKIKSKILQMPFAPSEGKFSYPREIKRQLLEHLYQQFPANWKEKVFFYLCMESPGLWTEVLGRNYPDNPSFEEDMKYHYFAKIKKRYNKK